MPASSSTENVSRPIPSDEARRLASRGHIAAVFLGFGLPYSLSVRRSNDPFVAHHGHQATVVTLAWLFICVIHGVLHLLIAATTKLQDYVNETTAMAGTPAAPAWPMEVLGVLVTVNSVTGVLEGIAVIVLALWMSRKALDGSWRCYPGMSTFVLKKSA